ncbi:hypothetical protein ACTHO5_05620 [Cytobacillus praedii]
MRDKFQEILDMPSNLIDIFHFGPDTFELHDISRKMLDNSREIQDKFQEMLDIPPIMLDIFSRHIKKANCRMISYK